VLDGDYYGMQQWQQPARDQDQEAVSIENESGNQPLPEDHNHGNAALVCGTGTCVRSTGTGLARQFGLESLWLQIEVRAVRV